MTQKKGGLLDNFDLNDDFGDFEENPIDPKQEQKEVIEQIKGDDGDDGEDEVEKKASKTPKKESTEKKEDEFENWDDDEDGAEKKVAKTGKTATNKEVAGQSKEEEIEDEPDEEERFTNLAFDLKDRGILANVEIPKDSKISEEKFFELHDEEVEKRVDETLESIYEEVTEEGKDFLSYLKNGGKASTYLTLVANTFKLDDLDPENPTEVNKTLRHYLTTYEKLDDEELEDKLKWLEDGGKSKSYAVKYFKTIKKDEQEAKEALLASQEEERRNSLEKVKKFNSSLKDVLSETEKVHDFVISKKDQKEIDNYLIKPTIKIGKNKYVPEFHAELTRILAGKTKQDKQDLILLAKLFKDGFALPDLEKQTTTKVVSKVKSRLSGSKNKYTSSSTSPKRTLADFIDE